MINLREIYFVNADALAKRIVEGGVSDLHALNHFIVGLILFGIGYEVPLSVGFHESTIPSFINWLGVAGLIPSAIISYYGAWLSYQTNIKGDGQDFFKRFAVLSLPIGIQLMLVFMVVALLLVLLSYLLATQFEGVGGGLSLIMFFLASMAFQCAFFLRMRSCLAIASGFGG